MTDTHEYTIEIPVALTVNKRDGSTVDVDIAQIPESFFADFVTDGIAEYIRDSSSAALANAFAVANPDNKSEGKALVADRNAWGMVNTESVATESAALMTAARDRLYAGERRVASTSNADPLDDWRVKVLRAIMQKPDGAAMKAEYNAIDSGEQKARKDYLLGVAAHADNVAWVDADAVTMRDAAAALVAKLAETKVKIAL